MRPDSFFHERREAGYRTIGNKTDRSSFSYFSSLIAAVSCDSRCISSN